jgi:hypothetical protein
MGAKAAQDIVTALKKALIDFALGTELSLLTVFRPLVFGI